MVILSICIPTHDRIEELYELVTDILKVNSSNFNIVITDNCSSDNTESIIKSINDERVIYKKNIESVPALLNMINAVNNGTGMFSLLCNDRDLINAEQLPDLLRFLEQNIDCSFVHVPYYDSKKNGSVQKYNNPFDALLHLPYAYHPTGMIFNRTLINRYIDIRKYEEYINVIYTYWFLVRDLLPFGNAAIYYSNIWSERPRQYLANNISGTLSKKDYYFYPNVRTRLCNKILEQLIVNNCCKLNDKEIEIITDDILTRLHSSLFSYKSNMADKYETLHYGLKRKYVSLLEMLCIYKAFYKDTLAFLSKSNCKENISKRWKKLRYKLFFKTIYLNFIVDFDLLKKVFR